MNEVSYFKALMVAVVYGSGFYLSETWQTDYNFFSQAAADGDIARYFFSNYLQKGDSSEGGNRTHLATFKP